MSAKQQLPSTSHIHPSTLTSPSGSATPPVPPDHQTEDDQSLVSLVGRFLARNKRTESVEKELEELMATISERIPGAGSFETTEDRDLCLETIKTHIARGNRKALGFLELVEKGIFEWLYIRVLSFSQITRKEKLVAPEALTIHDPCKIEDLLSWLNTTPDVFRPDTFDFPTPGEYETFRQLVTCYLAFFHQSSEQAAVMKVTSYNLLLLFKNQRMCIKYFPELNLFNFTSEESPAEVVARVANHSYRYFMSGRGDGFIVTLKAKKMLWEACTPGSDSKSGAPKYSHLVNKLNEITAGQEVEGYKCLSYEIVLLEVKKLQLPYKQAKNSDKSRLIEHLEQIIGECAAINEYGPDKCKTLNFILTDGDQWLFGVLRNPEKNEVGYDTRRNCFYGLFDNKPLTRTGDVIKLLAAWMIVSGDVLYDFFQSNDSDKSLDTSALC